MRTRSALHQQENALTLRRKSDTASTFPQETPTEAHYASLCARITRHHAAQKMLKIGCAALLGDAAGCTALLQDEIGCTEALLPLYIVKKRGTT